MINHSYSSLKQRIYELEDELEKKEQHKNFDFNEEGFDFDEDEFIN